MLTTWFANCLRNSFQNKSWRVCILWFRQLNKFLNFCFTASMTTHNIFSLNEILHSSRSKRWNSNKFYLNTEYVCSCIIMKRMVYKNFITKTKFIHLFTNKTEIVLSCSNIKPLKSNYQAVVKVPPFNLQDIQFCVYYSQYKFYLLNSFSAYVVRV